MPDGGKVIPGIGAHALGGRVGGGQAGEGLLQRQKPTEEGIILAIGDFRTGLYIVEVVVPLDGETKAPGLGLRFSPGQGLDSGIEVQFFLGQYGLLGASGFSNQTLKGNLVS
jgi:hypothetical protein